MATTDHIRRLLDSLSSPFTAELLFDGFHDTVYFIKNAAGQYLVVNETLVGRCGLKSKSQLIGRTSEEVLRSPFGATFTSQDSLVLASGKPLIGQLELHVYASRDVGWCLTSKYPLRGASGQVVGLVGVSRDLGRPDKASEDYQSVAQAIRFAEEHLSRPINVAKLAEIARLSRYQLDRRMQIAYGLTTGQWLLKQRLDRARQQLQTGETPIVEIAHNVGYADQSAFARQFRRATGLTPRQYRNSQRASTSPEL